MQPGKEHPRCAWIPDGLGSRGLPSITTVSCLRTSVHPISLWVSVSPCAQLDGPCCPAKLFGKSQMQALGSGSESGWGWAEAKYSV